MPTTPRTVFPFPILHLSAFQIFPFKPVLLHHCMALIWFPQINTTPSFSPQLPWHQCSVFPVGLSAVSWDLSSFWPKCNTYAQKILVSTFSFLVDKSGHNFFLLHSRWSNNSCYYRDVIVVMSSAVSLCKNTLQLVFKICKPVLW